MKLWTAFALAPAAFAAAACSSAHAEPHSANIKTQSAASQAAPAPQYDGEFQMIPAPKRLWESPLAIADFFLRGHPESSEGEPQLHIKMAKNPSGHMQIWMTALGYLDDSIGGIQWRLTIHNAGPGWGVSTAENRVMCQRGANAGKWGISPCP